MSTVTIISLIVSCLLILIIGIQGKNSEEISSALLGGDKDLSLFKNIKERGIDLFLKRSTIILIIIFFILIFIIFYQKGTL